MAYGDCVNMLYLQSKGKETRNCHWAKRPEVLNLLQRKKKPKHELERNSHFLYPHQDYIALFIPMNQEFYAVLQDLHNRIYAVGELGQL